jgi:hypothetical protein
MTNRAVLFRQERQKLSQSLGAEPDLPHFENRNRTQLDFQSKNYQITKLRFQHHKGRDGGSMIEADGIGE